MISDIKWYFFLLFHYYFIASQQLLNSILVALYSSIPVLEAGSPGASLILTTKAWSALFPWYCWCCDCGIALCWPEVISIVSVALILTSPVSGVGWGLQFGSSALRRDVVVGSPDFNNDGKQIGKDDWDWNQFLKHTWQPQWLRCLSGDFFSVASPAVLLFF